MMSAHLDHDVGLFGRHFDWFFLMKRAMGISDPRS